MKTPRKGTTMTQTTDGRARATLLALLLMVSLVALALPASADPAGASLTYVSNTTAGAGTPGNRTDPRGTITTITLDGLQQDSFWKGYVGNVTGKLTLDDATGNTIYDWDLTGVTITGEVYATRNSSVSFTGIQCAQDTTVVAEQDFNNMTGTDADSINQTFSGSTHTSFYVGATPVANSTCRAIATYVNDTPQAANESNPFQEILLEDADANLLYVTLIEDAVAGFDTQPYDFQMIVAESDVKSQPTTYYFFTEIGS